MEALPLYGPRCSGVVAYAKAHRGGRDYDARMGRVSAYLVDVTVYIDGGLPRHSAVSRPQNASDVNVGEEHGPVRGGRY